MNPPFPKRDLFKTASYEFRLRSEHVLQIKYILYIFTRESETNCNQFDKSEAKFSAWHSSRNTMLCYKWGLLRNIIDEITHLLITRLDLSLEDVLPCPINQVTSSDVRWLSKPTPNHPYCTRNLFTGGFQGGCSEDKGLERNLRCGR